MHGRKNDHGECCRVFQRVGKMLSAPAVYGPISLSHSKKFDQTLSQPDHARDADEQRHREAPTALPIRNPRARFLRGEKHAPAHEQIPDNLRIARQHVRKNDIAEFPILRLR